MKRSSKDKKKFNRTAEEIWEEGYRNESCDSSTLNDLEVKRERNKLHDVKDEDREI